ncbi:arsenate reductase (glutaredoxin) [Salinivibrio sp. ES.052]|uniref:arsenate reductase (glutaredoxin) n=1 Tax=Salinivibrio sp. ES.052 TaxID=1882823 RepID=UPI00092AC4FF|nr:arsenate reductase (glutaredoxin) [Salinivibrio sp. ES.052]SIN98923.1 arsenate reductase [Salinivibrio sp. ES.052]
MTTITLYHNPRCSKSRETLKLLESEGVTPNIVKYLDSPLSAEALSMLKQQLGVASFRDMMRTKEADYKAANLGDASVEEAQLLEAMVNNPKLMERPIAIKGEKAVIGRPPENVLALIQ